MFSVHLLYFYWTAFITMTSVHSLIVSLKIGDTMDHAWSLSLSAEIFLFLCSLFFVKGVPEVIQEVIP